MEQILNFFEQYWGYTLFGGITVGTLVMFVITAVKLFLKLNAAKKESNEQTSLIKVLFGKLEARDKALSEKQTELEKQALYFQNVQAVTFKSISYLIMASKLSTEDKLALTEEFSKLTNTSVEQVHEASQQVEEKVQEKTAEAEVIKDVVVNSIEKTKSLLDKYSA